MLDALRLHEAHPLEFDASLIFHAQGKRFRDAGSAEFEWGDLAAVVECLPWDAPLRRAVHPKDWSWGNPMMDPLVGAVDLLANIAVKTARPQGLKKSDIPKPTERPWSKGEKRASADVVSLAELDALYTTA